MSDNNLEITTYEGEGYFPLVNFETWRVAFLRFSVNQAPPHITSMERHLETDEIFVLLTGQALLFTAGTGEKPAELAAELMQPCKLYNVKRALWHATVLSQAATVLIVENQNTSPENSAFADLTSEQRTALHDAVNANLPTWWM